MDSAHDLVTGQIQHGEREGCGTIKAEGNSVG